MSGGEISEMLLAAVDLDGAKLIKLLFSGDKNVPVRCAVIDYDVKQGIMDSEAFVIDTKDTSVLGEGQISLVDEAIKMKSLHTPKKSVFRAFARPYTLPVRSRARQSIRTKCWPYALGPR